MSEITHAQFGLLWLISCLCFLLFHYHITLSYYMLLLYILSLLSNSANEAAAAKIGPVREEKRIIWSSVRALLQSVHGAGGYKILFSFHALKTLLFTEFGLHLPPKKLHSKKKKKCFIDKMTLSNENLFVKHTNCLLVSRII